MQVSAAAAPMPAYPDAGGYMAPLPGDLDDQPMDWRRLASAVLARKWLLGLALVVGLAGATYSWLTVQPTYTAEGSLWVQVEGTRASAGDVTPIRQSGLLENSAWVELLRTFAVLDPVVVQQRLYISSPEEFDEAFADFRLADQFVPGGFVLTVGADGKGYQLDTQEGLVVETGTLGAPVGEKLGFLWTPSAGALRAGAEVPFRVIPPRDAARRLAERLVTRIDRDGNFISLSLDGSDPESITTIVNSMMGRLVELADELKRGKLQETLEILEEQLTYSEQELADAERALEEFRVATITLPSDEATPIAPGLEVTTDPVIGGFFRMKVEVEQIRRDRLRLQEVLRALPESGVRIETLEVIPAAAQSSELRVTLDELVQARSELRTLRDRYSDDYPPVQELLTRIGTLERGAIPRIVNGIMSELSVREEQLGDLVGSASAELASIPPRTIEEGRLRRRVVTQENIYNDLRQRVETARLADASSIPDVRILYEASVPLIPTGDARLRWAAMMLLGSLAGAVGIALLLDRMDSTVRYPTEVSHDIGLDILGSIPRIEGGTGKRAEQNAEQVLEAFRELRLMVNFAYGSAGPVTLTITSPSPGEGKSLIATNLAVAFAEVGKRTLLVDADTRRGDAHELLGARRAPGLTDYLRNRSGQDIIQSTQYDRLDFIGSGTRGTSTPELLASSRMASFLGTLKRGYDVIIVDSPPLGAGADPVLLSGLTGNMALVIRAGSTEKGLAMAKLDMLSRLPIRILGAILNHVEPKGAYRYHYYASFLPEYAPRPEGASEESGGRLLAETGSGTGGVAD